MKLITQIDIKTRKHDLPGFIEAVYRSGSHVHTLNLLREDASSAVYQLQLVYDDKKRFSELIQELQKESEKYTVISLVNLLEEETVGGILSLSGKFPVKNASDYEMKILGATELIYEKIVEGNGMRHSGISKNVALISGILKDEEARINHILEVYAKAEENSVIINRFTGLNAYPIMIQFDHEEDLIKTIQRIELGFSAIKIYHIDEADITSYDQILSDVTIPVVSEALDDIPLYLLTIVSKLIAKYRLKPREVTVGFIGVDISVMRLTRIFMKSDYYRVLGNDGNERFLLSFEKHGGLATTNENIFSNADIIIIVKKLFTTEELQKIRPGVLIVSLLKAEDIESSIVGKRGVRELVKADRNSLSALSPGIIKGVVECGFNNINDMQLVNLSRKMNNLVPDTMEFPDIFSDIHEKIADLIRKM